MAFSRLGSSVRKNTSISFQSACGFHEIVFADSNLDNLGNLKLYIPQKLRNLDDADHDL